MEGLADYSMLALVEELHGPARAAATAGRLEAEYLGGRTPGHEPPILDADESIPHERVIFQKRGARVLHMMSRHLGKARLQAGMKAFATRAEAEPFASASMLLGALRSQATDPMAFDRFVEQWIAGTVLPEFRLTQGQCAAESGSWICEGRIQNLGTGAIGVTVAAVDGAGNQLCQSRIPDVDSVGGRFQCRADVLPAALVADPDVAVLQLHRDRARFALR